MSRSSAIVAYIRGLAGDTLRVRGADNGASSRVGLALCLLAVAAVLAPTRRRRERSKRSRRAA